MIRNIPPRKSIPPRKRRFIGEQQGRNPKNKSEDPEKYMNEFKKKLRNRGKRKEY